MLGDLDLSAGDNKCQPGTRRLSGLWFCSCFLFDRGIWRVFRSPGPTARRFPRGGFGRSKLEVHPEGPVNAALVLNEAQKVTEYGPEHHKAGSCT